MNTQKYLIDTNVIIGLEDNHLVKPDLSELVRLCSKHGIGIYVHELAKEDIARDKDLVRRKITLSKIDKFQILKKVRNPDKQQLITSFGLIKRQNDFVDVSLLHAVKINAADFLVTEDKGIHERAQSYSANLAQRVIFVADAVQLLRTTYEPTSVPVRYVEEVPAHSISLDDKIFDSLRADYPGFDKWWQSKCVPEHRLCWIVSDGTEIAGIAVRKDETKNDTSATMSGNKILKICTFKVRPENRGIKLGELLLKNIFWYAQVNRYNLVYLTTFSNQNALIAMLEYYGFENTIRLINGELMYEKRFNSSRLIPPSSGDIFETDRLNYPRFVSVPTVRAFGVPIQEKYHDILYPDLVEIPRQGDLFDPTNSSRGPRRPGNTIRKVYLCRAPSKLGPPGSLLVFYKGKSRLPPSQAFTALGVLEGVSIAESTQDLQRFSGGRSVYSEDALESWGASQKRPVKVINFLLAAYIKPEISAEELVEIGIFSKNPPQSIFEINSQKCMKMLAKINLGFEK